MTACIDPLCMLVAEALSVRPESVSDASSSETIDTWDSIAGMSLMVLVEETYAVTFEASELALLTSVRAIRRLLRQKGVKV
jgi:acyl carrier protein